MKRYNRYKFGYVFTWFLTWCGW